VLVPTYYFRPGFEPTVSLYTVLEIKDMNFNNHCDITKVLEVLYLFIV